MSPILESKIASVRRKHVAVATGSGVAAAIGAAVLLLGAGMLLDFWLNLSVTWRAAFLAVNLAAVVWILLYAIFGPVLYGPDDDEIALMVEDAEPVFRSRLISSVQLSRPEMSPAGASPALIRATLEQTESLAGPMDFTRVIKTDSLIRIVVIALGILIVGGGLFAYGGDSSVDLLKRAFLSTTTPVPRKTRVLAVTDNLLIAKGDSVELIALADGVAPDEGRLYLKTIATEGSGNSSGRKQDFALAKLTLDAAKIQQLKEIAGASKRNAKLVEAVIRKLDSAGNSAAAYSVTIENVQESFKYYVKLNDGESDEFEVKVLPRPAVTKIEVKQVYPAYTGKGIETKPLGDLAILQGSKLQLSLTTNKAMGKGVGANVVHLIGTDKKPALTVNEKDPKQLSGEFDVPTGTTGFSIELTDENGLKSKDPAVYRIDLVPDKAPVVRITVPNRKEVLLVRNAKQKVAFEAVDDFAIGKVAIKYKLDEGAEKEIPLDLKGMKPRTFPGAYDWKLNEVQSTSTTRPMMEGSIIEYWVEVEDTNNISKTGPGKGVSEHYMIRIGTEEEVRRELAGRIADIGSGLRNATDDQEREASKTQTILLEKQPTTAPSK